MSTVSNLKIKIFADGADKKSMLELYKNPNVKGFTTNPTLMRQAGVTDYKAFALDLVSAIPDRSISFEVFADDIEGMREQALTIASWGKNVYVKIPFCNTKGESTVSLVRELAESGVKLNLTAMMTLEQAKEMSEAVGDRTPAYISVFAGRVADTGIDPIPMMTEAVKMLACYPNQELLWASSRELLNVFQADSIGCQIITVTTEIVKRLALVGKNLDEYALDTVKMFHRDASAAGFEIEAVVGA